MISNNSLSYVLGYFLAWVLLFLLSFIAIKALNKTEPVGWLHKIGANLIAAIIGIMFVVLSMEGYYGFFYDEPDSYGLLLTSQRWFKKHYKYNNVGLRDNKDYYFEKEKQRIVFIGDSYTIGHGIKNIEDRFTGIIEARLNKEFAGRYEVYTIAKNGWDTAHEADYFNQLIKNGFEADTIILCFTMNDIGWASPEASFKIDALNASEPQSWILANSYFLNFLYVRINIFSTETAGGYYGWLKDTYSGVPLELEKMVLREFKALCTKKGFHLKVAIFPLIGDLSSGFKMKTAHNEISLFFKEEGIPFIDLADKLKEFPAKKLTVNRFDAHPNEFTHRIIADEIWEKLISFDQGL